MNTESDDDTRARSTIFKTEIVIVSKLTTDSRMETLIILLSIRMDLVNAPFTFAYTSNVALWTGSESSMVIDGLP